jgi:nitrite reductase/ring-hydroxylating ferredoxin subunit
MPRVAAGRADALPPDRPVLREVAGRRIAIVRSGDTIYAVDDSCPHAGGPLSEGAVLSGAIVCPYHTWMWDLATGACVAGRQGTRVRVYPAGVEAGEVWVEVP